ncbi:MAG: hypothetical protein EOL98_15125, partial [Negativicutes bacterium]|nr:hypothetical protein [Negativicutes bacterium]
MSLMASEPSNLTDFQKWQQSNVEKFNAQETALPHQQQFGQVSRQAGTYQPMIQPTIKNIADFVKTTPTGLKDFAVGIIKSAGANLQYNFTKAREDAKAGFGVYGTAPGRFGETPTQVKERAFESINKDWNDYLVRRKETVAYKALNPVQQEIQSTVDWSSKAQTYGFTFGSAIGQSTFAGVTGGLGVAPLLADSMDRTITEMENAGYDVTTTDAMVRVMGTAAINVGTEYMFNVLDGFGSVASAQMTRSVVGRSVLSKVTGLWDNIAMRSTASFNKFIASTPNPTLARFVAYLAQKGNEEGMEELASYIGTGILQQWTTDKDKKFSEIVNVKDATTNYILGGVMGFAVSGIAGVPGLKNQFPKSNEKINQIKDKPTSEITTDEYMDIGETIVSEAKSKSVQTVLEKTSNEKVAMAEYANEQAETQYKTGEFREDSIKDLVDEISELDEMINSNTYDNESVANFKRVKSKLQRELGDLYFNEQAETQTETAPS